MRLLSGTAGIQEAAALLRAGRLVAFGTETVYGLGGDATCGPTVASIFAAKGRPQFNPLICHFPTAEGAFGHVVPTPAAERLAAAFWPGPLTLVLPRRATSPIDLLASAGLDTLAVRVPGQQIDRAASAPWQHQGQRTGPERGGQALGGRGGDNMAEGCLSSREVADQRVELRAALRRENAGDGLAVGGVTPEAVDGLGAKGDKTAGA